MKHASERLAFSAALATSVLLSFTTTTSSASVALASPPGQAPSAPASLLAGGDGGSASGAAGQRWIPLITGDGIGVNSKGAVVSARFAKGREQIPIRVETIGEHTYAFPDDAKALLRSGRLDRNLFDMTLLSTPAYAQRQDLSLIVKYDPAHSAAGRSALRADSGAEVLRTLPSVNADALRAPVNGTTGLWSALTAGSAGAGKRAVAPGIDSVWLDAAVQAGLDKSVPQIGGPEAWAAGYDGTGTRIAVLDSGVDATHPDLAGQVVAERNFSYSPVTDDLLGHGTHVAPTAAGTGAKSGGRYKGVAPGARILDGKVLDDRGSGAMSSIIAGMEWATAEKADVVNLSLGGYDSPEIDPLEDAVNRLSAESDTLFVVAAGNSGRFASGTINSPGSADAALTVGAVDKQDVLAPFSSTGPRAGDGGIKPDLTAPGVDIGAAAAHDTGSTPVTLKLTVDGVAPDGGAAPAGLFTVGDAQITIPAHGEKAVKVTADASRGGTAAGFFTGRITAAGDGQTVGAVLAVELEPEMYDVTVKPLDRNGDRELAHRSVPQRRAGADQHLPAGLLLRGGERVG